MEIGILNTKTLVTLFLVCYLFSMKVLGAAAIFAGGCFWCMEADFEKLKGVKIVISGYTGGNKPHPSYEEVTSQSTGHVEAIRVNYNPKIVSYKQLLNFFWRHIDPTDAGGQFNDRGSSYVSAIFYQNQQEKIF